MTGPIEIAGRTIGEGHKAYIIAEISGNHNQQFERAEELVRAAASAGAEAVKLQTYTPDTITIDCDNEYFRIQKGTLWEGKTLYGLYGEAYTPWEWHPQLKEIATEEGMAIFSTPFDNTAVDFLESQDVPAYKIASFEIVDIPLIRRVAQTGRPMIISTGMASLGEIELAVRTAREYGCNELALLKCTSAYPSPPSSMNLRTIRHLAAAFACPAGLSDHTLGVAVPVAAVALGATIIEKHITLRRSDGGPDAAFSLEPEEFAAMVQAVRTAEEALGEVTYQITPDQQASRAFRRSLFVVEDIAQGQPFTPKNVRSIRPGHGLPPREYDNILGRRAATNLKRGTPLTREHIL